MQTGKYEYGLGIRRFQRITANYVRWDNGSMAVLENNS